MGLFAPSQLLQLPGQIRVRILLKIFIKLMLTSPLQVHVTVEAKHEGCTPRHQGDEDAEPGMTAVTA